MFKKFDICVLECGPELQLDVADEFETLERIKPPQAIMRTREVSETLEEGEKDSVRGERMSIRGDR